jgi:hypothetical protein
LYSESFVLIICILASLVQVLLRQLPPLVEWVLSVRCSPLQLQLYEAMLSFLATRTRTKTKAAAAAVKARTVSVREQAAGRSHRQKQQPCKKEVEHKPNAEAVEAAEAAEAVEAAEAAEGGGNFIDSNASALAFFHTAIILTAHPFLLAPPAGEIGRALWATPPHQQTHLSVDGSAEHDEGGAKRSSHGQKRTKKAVSKSSQRHGWATGVLGDFLQQRRLGDERLVDEDARRVDCEQGSGADGTHRLTAAQASKGGTAAQASKGGTDYDDAREAMMHAELVSHSGKMSVLMRLLQEFRAAGDSCIVFTQVSAIKSYLRLA